MSWLEQLRADPLPWLLEGNGPGVRYMALRDLFDLTPGDPQLAAARRTAHRDGPLAAVLAQMDAAGFWVNPGPGYAPKYRSTLWSVILLAQLGGSIEEDDRIGRACAYVLDHALNPGGQFSLSGPPSGTVDCLQGNLCWALRELGCRDPRLEIAFDWLARSVTGEGIAPSEERDTPVRYYAGKCGPGFACGYNNRLPCAWGAVKCLLALGRWPAGHRTPLMDRAIARGVAFLLGTDPALAGYPNGYSEKPSGNWWKFGFPVFYITDLLQNVEALISRATAATRAWPTRSMSSARSRTPTAAGRWSTIMPASRGWTSGRRSSLTHGDAPRAARAEGSRLRDRRSQSIRDSVQP